MDLAYALVLVVLFVATLLELVRQIRRASGGDDIEALRHNERSRGDLPFSTLLFSAWDHTLTNEEAALVLQHSIVSRVRETLQETGGVNLNPRPRTSQQQTRLWLARLLSLVVTFGLMAGGVIIIIYTVINNPTLRALFSLLPSIIIAAVNGLFPVIIALVANIEQWEVRTPLSRRCTGISPHHCSTTTAPHGCFMTPNQAR